MRKRKDGFKKISTKTIILIILTIFLITISVGYSYLQQSLSMVGKSTISKSNGSGQIINGESTYTWTLINSWGGGGSSYIYQIKIEIFNKDEAIEKWRLSFDVPDSYDHAGSNIWIAESSSYENGRVILDAHGWNASIPTGGSVSLEFQLAFKEEVNDLISNLELVDSTKISDEETENNTPESGETEGTTNSEQTDTPVSN